MRKHDYPEELPSSSTSKRRDRQSAGVSGTSRYGHGHGHSTSGTVQRPATTTNATSSSSSSYADRNERVKAGSSSKSTKQYIKSVPVEATSSASASDRVDVSKLSHELTKRIFQTTNPSPTFVVKRPLDLNSKSESGGGSGRFHSNNSSSSGPSSSKKAATLNNTQTFQIKKILAECLQNFESSDESLTRRSSLGEPIRKHVHNHSSFKASENLPFAPVSTPDSLGKTSLLRSYLSGSNPTREEYVSKKKNVPNSLISSDSIHHSIFLESGRERRQCLLQYLSNVVSDGQVVIYANSIPGVESLMNFLTKHGFQVNAVHPRMLMAESNWILSEFSLKKFTVLLCAEDHYHSCPAHFRWVKTIINYELPICNPLENWAIRNGIVEFSDNLPVHIYTFIKKSCPLDNELVKLLHLDSVDHEEDNMIQSLSEHIYAL